MKKTRVTAGLGLNKNDIIEADVDDNGLDGDGIVHYGGATVFVRGAIKGERVRAKIVNVKSDICFAIIESIITPSPHRVKAPCPYYLKCGGCSMQHIAYSEQLEIKAASLLTTLNKHKLDLKEVGHCVPSDKAFGYRNKLSLPVRNTPPQIGFFAKRSHRVIDIEDCILQKFNCARLIKIFRDFFRESDLTGYDEMTGTGDVRHIVARSICGTLIIALVASRPLKERLKALNSALKKEYGNLYALYLNINLKNNNVILSEDFEFIGGNSDEIRYEGTQITVHPAAFFQVNDNVRSKLYLHIKSLIENAESRKENRVIIDAYAGAGMLSLSLTLCAEKVYSVENNIKAHEAALNLKKSNAAVNLECVLADCAAAVPEITKKENGKNIVIILDPPRTGADERVLNAALNSTVNDIIYISCNPATLARDLKILSAAFEVKSVTPYDMFPQTGALETLSYLKRKE